MATTETPTQGTNEDLLQRIERLESEKRGILRDLQGERDTRHSYEKRLSEIEQSLNSAEKEPEGSSQDKVVQLSQDPDGYITSLINQRLEQEVKPLKQEVAQVRTERQFEKAYQWLGKQEKKDADEVIGSKLEEEIVRVIKDHNLSTMNPIDGTKAAYKIWKQELKERESKEEERNRSIEEKSGERVTTPVRAGTSRFTRQQIMDMSRDEFVRNLPAIKEAEQNGLIT